MRSCKCLPEEDVKYFGSFKDKTFQPTEKIILAQFETRKEAVKAEILLHNFFEVHVNKHFANRARQTAVGYDQTGVAQSSERVAKRVQTRSKIKEQQPERYARLQEMAREMMLRLHQERAEDFKRWTKEGQKAGVAHMNAHPEKKLMRNKKISETLMKRLTIIYPNGDTVEYKSKTEAVQIGPIPKTSLAKIIAGKTVPKYQGFRAYYSDYTETDNN